MMRTTSRLGPLNLFYSMNLKENFNLALQKLLDALLTGKIDEMVALLTSGIDVNTTLEVFLYHGLFQANF